MKLSYVVRSINGWFHRVVHEPDELDESLDRALMDAPLVQLANVAGLAVDRAFTTFMDVARKLAGHAEQGERELGLEPLPETSE